MSQNATLTTRSAKKVVVRKAGPVRLTAEASAAYIPWMCLPVTP
ncbi:hypothetical protein [Plantactinospora sp. KBS50]|nr:hypothetical protein [Plantactinospora sp. KBS50]